MRAAFIAGRAVQDQCASPSLARDFSARLLEHDGEVTVREIPAACVEDALVHSGSSRDYRQVMRLLMRNLRFAATAAASLARNPQGPFDVIFTMPPGAIGGYPATWFARRAGGMSWLHLERLETEIAFRLLDQCRAEKPRGLVQLVRRGWANLENRALRAFHAVSVPSEQMRRRLIARGVAPEHVCVVPYWGDFAPVKKNPAALRQEFGIPSHMTAAVYAGPLTRCNALDVIVEAAHVLRQRSDIQVVIGGDGPEFPKLYRLTRNLPNVRLLALTMDLVRELQSVADVHLLPVHGALGEALVPPQMASLFASGKPTIIAAAPRAAYYQDLAECAVVVSIHQPPLMAQAVVDLAASPEESERLGRAARAYAEKHWTREAVVARWELELLIRRAASLPRGPMEPETAGRPAAAAQPVRKE